jgi:hypothetical protein
VNAQQLLMQKHLERMFEEVMDYVPSNLADTWADVLPSCVCGIHPIDHILTSRTCDHYWPFARSWIIVSPHG